MSMKNQVLRDIPRASAHFREAEAALGQDSDDPLLGWLHLGLASVAGELFDREQKLKSSRRAMVIGKRLGDELLWINAAQQSGDELTNGGRFTRGFGLRARAWERADRLNDASVCSSVAGQIGYAETLRRDPVEARRWLLRELQKDRVAKAPSARQSLSHMLGHALVVAGKPTEARTLVREAGCLCLEAIVCFLGGDWEDAEKIFLRDLEEQARKPGRPWQEFFASLWLAKLRRASGRYADAEGLLKRAIDIVEKGGAVLVEIDARQELSSLLGEIGAPQQAHQHLARCREIMTPREDWRGLAGAVARAEAIVASAEGRLDDAQAQFAHAVEIFQRYEVHFDEAEALYYWGRALNMAGNSARANEKFDVAIEIYKRHGGGQRWIDRVEAERARIRPEPIESITDSTAVAHDTRAVFQRAGDYWTIAYGGTTFRLKHSKGLAYLATLLCNPNREFHALELVIDPASYRARPSDREQEIAAHGRFEESGMHVNGPGDAGPMLDREAREAYARRLAELRETIEDARETNNDERIAEAEDEIEQLSRELSHSVGLGGRARVASSPVERARLSVWHAIKSALEKIAVGNPDLGRLLSTTIKTGSVCVYRPDPRFPILWQF